MFLSLKVGVEHIINARASRVNRGRQATGWYNVGIVTPLRPRSTEKLKRMSPTEAAYIAGYVDADGCIILGKRKAPWTSSRIGFRPEVVITGSAKGVLFKIAGMAGGKLVPIPYRSSKLGKNVKQMYRVRFTTRHAKDLIEQIIPYLILKKRQAALVLQYYGMVDNKVNCGNSLDWFVDVYDEMRELNRVQDIDVST